MKGVVAKDNWQNLCEAKGYEQGLEGGPDPAFSSLFRENPASRMFFIGFLISTKADKV